MKKSKMLIPNRSVDIRPLNQRETKLNVRKGMLKRKPAGFFDKTEYKEQLLFDNSQRNCNGYEETKNSIN